MTAHRELEVALRPGVRAVGVGEDFLDGARGVYKTK